MTRPRIAVYGALEILGGHRVVEDVFAAVSEIDPSVARASVFNALADLTRVELVMVADAGPGPSHYEVAGSWHHHMVCRSCGEIVDVPCAVGSKPCLFPGLDVGEIDEAQIIFRGVCLSCLENR